MFFPKSLQQIIQHRLVYYFLDREQYHWTHKVHWSVYVQLIPDCDVIVCERSVLSSRHIFTKMLYDDWKYVPETHFQR
jgi:hypothetical protein